MRRPLTMLLCFGVAALLAACVQIGPDAGEGGAKSTDCDNKNDCNACSNCARADACAAEEGACQQNSACVGLNQCLLNCGQDQQCESSCFDANPQGIIQYDALLACIICGACPNDCRGLAQCK